MPTTKYFYESGWKTYETNSYDNSERLLETKKYTDSNKYIKEKYTYDILDRVLTKEVYDNTTKLYTESYTYSKSGSSSTVEKTTAAEDGTQTAAVKEYYDNLGRLIKREIGTGTDKQTYDFTYDYLGNMLTETDAKGNVTAYQYNIDGDVTQITYPDGDQSFNVYDKLGRLVREFDREFTAIRYTYDELGRVTDTKRNMEGSSTAQTKRYYDKNSNVIKESVKNNAQGTSGAGSTSTDATYTDTEYAYDNMNNVIGVTSADGAVQYWYDKAGRVTSMATGLTAINPNSTSPSTGAITRYTYNTLGYVATEKDALNQTVSYTYDYAGNAKKITDRNGNVTTNVIGPYGMTSSSVTDGDAAEKYTYTYNNLGQLTETKLYSNNTVTDTVTATYDIFGRKLTETNNGRTNSYSYDKNSNMTGYQQLYGTTVENSNSYTYDVMNRLTQADLNGIIVSYTYDDVGNLTSKTTGNIETTIAYNNLYLPTSYVNKVNNMITESYSCTYSVDGNRLTDNDTTNSISKAYTYDGNGRLVSEAISGAYDYTKTYSYDNRGNRLTETVTGDDSYVMTNTYDKNNRLTNQIKTVGGTAESETNYYYDPNGNQTFKQHYTYAQGGTENISGGDITTSTVESFTHNLRNQLTGYKTADTTASYEYGANGLRKSKTVNGTTTGFVWNGTNLAAELNGSSITTLYNYGVDGIATKTTGNVTKHYLKDAHGSVVDITDTNTNFESNEPYSYDAFGKVISQDTPDPFGYCGEYYDSESGLIYLRARYYDPSIGRFITEDPAKDGMNWYSYCAGNPVNMWDPWGLKITCNTDDSEEVLRMLKELTVDKLEFTEYTDENGNGIGMGEFRIVKSYDTDRHVGQTLISNLISSDTEININTGFDLDGETNYTTEKDSTNTITVYIDNGNTRHFGDFVKDKASGLVHWEEIEDYIYLGHELVHAWREDKGYYVPSMEPDGYYFYGNVREEELQTCGINYNDIAGNPIKNYSSFSGSISENGLRLENPNVKSVRVKYTP